MAKTLITSTRPYIFSSGNQFLFRSVRHLFQSQRCLVSRSNSADVILSCQNFSQKVGGFKNGDVKRRATSLFRSSVVGNRAFSVNATNVNDAGPIDQSLIQSMEKKIKEHLNADSVSVKDMSGDGRHVCIDVVSSAFEGQSSVNRQRMVYKAIWEELQNAVHAVDQMTTKTPGEVAS